MSKNKISVAGGKARAKKLSKKRRREIASMGGAAKAARQYQDEDLLHGNGKAVPVPKQPTRGRMVSRFFKKSINPNTVHPYEAPKTRAAKSAQRKLWKKQQRVLEKMVSLR